MELYTAFTDIDSLTPNKASVRVEAMQKVIEAPLKLENNAQMDCLEARILLTIRDYDNKATLLKGYIDRLKHIGGQ